MGRIWGSIVELGNIIAVLGAVATFLFGMSTMTDGLEKLSSGRLENILERLTSNVIKGVLLGAVVTGLIQSSAATTVMCVGFVNAGIMKLEQTVGIIMGANIGTTVTAQLLSLGDISSDNIVLMFLKPSFLGPILAVIGIIFYMFIKSGHKKTIGQIVLGLGLLFIGMNTMSTAVAPLQDLPEFQAVFTAFSNPFLGVAVGALITALLQSSSASMGILQAISTTGVVTFHIAMPLIMGQNIGTCITALISSIGASRNAKRTAMIHLFFNIIGSLFFLVALYAGNALFSFPFWGATMSMSSIANLHLAFNVACTALLLPFNRLLVRLVELTIPDSGADPVSSGGYTYVTDDLYYSGGSLGTLKIPAIDLSVKIYQGTGSGTLAKGAGHFTDTSIWDGTVALAGHNRGVNNHFGKIHTLELGDKITLTTKLGTRTYQVTSVSKISETDRSAMTPTGENRIVLYTCVMNQSAYRWCVQAVAD